MKQIYLIQNLVTEMVYVGQSISVDCRFRRHQSDLKKNRHSNQHLQNAWNKYGENAFEFIILCEVSTQEELDRIETHLISWYKSLALCYNFEDNPRGRGPLSDETKKKISLANTGRIPSEITKEKMSQAHKGKKLNEHVKQSLIESNRTRVVSAETRCKMRAAKVGKPLSEEHKVKLLTIKRKAKSFRIQSPSGEVFESSNITQFAKANGLNPGNLINVINGKLPHTRGWKLVS